VGKFTFEVDPDFAKKLIQLGDFDDIAVEMLEEVTPILKSHVMSEVEKHKDTGDLLASIKSMKKPKKNKYGWFTAVLPSSEDSHGVRNMAKLAHLEYGMSNITPTPILSKAINDATPEIVAKMEEVFERKVNK